MYGTSSAVWCNPSTSLDQLSEDDSIFMQPGLSGTSGSLFDASDSPFLDMDDLFTSHQEHKSYLMLEVEDLCYEREAKRAKYCLAVVDEEGNPVRPVTADEYEDILNLIEPIPNLDDEEEECPESPASSDACSSDCEKKTSSGKNVPAASKQASFHHKSGGPCQHCGSSESPQWRRGPPEKPTLCNACGIRFQRGKPLSGPAKA